MSDIREAFEALKKLYVAQERPDRADLYNTVKAALSANGGEAVGIVRHRTDPASDNPDAFIDWQFGGDVTNLPDGTELYPAPPSVAVPEGLKSKVLELCSAVENGEDLPPVKYALKCGRLINEVKDMLTAAPSPDHSGDANKMVDDLPVMRDQSDLSGGETDADHIADAGKVVPIGYLTNQAVARLQSDERLNGEHLYAFKPDDLSKFQAVYLAPTVKESLTIEDFNGMCRIVEAVSQMTDGFAIDQCHMDRAREIVQDATRLRTAGDEGEGV